MEVAIDTGPPVKQASLADVRHLVERIDAQVETMGAENENRMLLEESSRWLVLMAKRILELQAQAKARESRIVLAN